MPPAKSKRNDSKSAATASSKNKRTRAEPEESEDDVPGKKQKNGKSATDASQSDDQIEQIDFSSPSPSKVKAEKVAESYNFKISSWNINGIRSWLDKKGIEFLNSEKPDILCLQETKCSDDKLPSDAKNVKGYHSYWISGEKAGYSGVMLLSKNEPHEVTYGIGVEKHDQEGRVITAEYEKFYLVTVYVPNSGRGLVRLDYRMEWDRDFFKYLNDLSKKKEVILCGDMNVSHLEIDLAKPGSNKKNAGFTKEERDSFGTLLEGGFIDTFRFLYPKATGVYSFWTFMRNARANNVGWRLDYFITSKGLTSNIHDSLIHTKVMGSDHCPVSLLLDMPAD